MTAASEMGVGIDLVSVPRISRLLENPRFVARIYSPEEVAHYRGKSHGLAGAFAVKEAVRKWYGGQGLAMPPFAAITVGHNPAGSPLVYVDGHDVGCRVSVTHDADMAAAIVMGNAHPSLVRFLEGVDAKRLRFVPRVSHSSKVDAGTVVVVGGSEGLSGAPYLAAMGAARGGAGRVRCLVPASVYPVVAARCIEVMVHPLPEEEGRVGMVSWEAIERHLEGASAVVIGPGLGRSPGVSELVTHLLHSSSLPVVIDADALDTWSDADPVGASGGGRILTPHAGEMARLLGWSRAKVEEDPPAAAAEAHTRSGATIVLKGSATCVVGDKPLARGPGDVVALATAGTGDVLSGVIAALAASGLTPNDAAYCGVWVHGLAGRLVQQHVGRVGALATDLLPLIPSAATHLAHIAQSEKRGTGRDELASPVQPTRTR